ncbi:MAG: hypothetical protein MI861_03545 [Pirellulales bacterium]|nr:hypothetical protein [Pirellulales bacterium]
MSSDPANPYRSPRQERRQPERASGGLDSSGSDALKRKQLRLVFKLFGLSLLTTVVSLLAGLWGGADAFSLTVTACVIGSILLTIRGSG